MEAVAAAGRRCDAVAWRRRMAVLVASGEDMVAGRGVNRGAVLARDARARVVWRDAIVRGCGAVWKYVCVYVGMCVCGGGQASAGQQCGG